MNRPRARMSVRVAAPVTFGRSREPDRRAAMPARPAVMRGSTCLQLVDGDIEAEIRGRLRGAAVDAGIEMSAVDTHVLEREAIGNATQRACGRDRAA